MIGKRILVVEDNPDVRRMYAAFFARKLARASVDVAEDGAQALLRIEKGTYDLVVTDLSMPNLDGRQLYVKTGEHCASRSLPMPRFIFCSAVASAMLEVEPFCASGANLRLLKPFSLSKLEKAVLLLLTAPPAPPPASPPAAASRAG